MILKHHITTKNLQSGRSMVEMLGTLAIIGVLSVGAIAGYSYGMDKYRANQTINDVMLRAVDVMTQLSQGRKPNLEPEWGKKGTVYDMIEIQDETNKTWGIVVDGVPSRVCQMVGDALKTQATVYVGNAERGDTTDNDPCESSDENTMEFYFEPIEKILTCDPECPSGEVCRWGECVSEIIEISKWPTDSACTQNSDCEPCGYCGSASDGSQVCAPSNGMDCTINTTNDGMCHWGECLPKGCDANTPCTGLGEYCASPNSSCEEAFPSGKSGTCVKADFKPLTADGKEYWVSNTKMSWWDADAGCKALGKVLGKSMELVGVSEILNGWNGNNDYNRYEFTALGNTLRSKLSYHVWTSDDYSSCEAYGVNMEHKYAYPTNRNDNSYSTYCLAVCQ